MGVGLNISKNILVPPDKNDYISYNGIYMSKESARAMKAWKTRREKQNKKSYDRPKKNEIRDKIVSLIKEAKGEKILTMDTEEYLLAKKIKDATFFIAEDDKTEYLKMLEEKPNNVFLHYGNISEMADIIYNFDVIYLDFCCTYETAKLTIKKIINKIDSAKLVGFTFCLRRHEKKMVDYRFDIINKLNYLLNRHMNLVYARSYSDIKHAPMLTIFFENIEPETQKECIKYLFDEKLCEWLKITIEKEYPHIWYPDWLTSDEIDSLFRLAVRERMISFPRRTPGHQLMSPSDVRYYFRDIIDNQLCRIWTKKMKYDHFSYHILVDDGLDKFLVKSNNQINNCSVCNEKDGIFIDDNRNFCYHCILKYRKNKKEEFEKKKHQELYSFPRKKTIISKCSLLRINSRTKTSYRKYPWVRELEEWAETQNWLKTDYMLFVYFKSSEYEHGCEIGRYSGYGDDCSPIVMRFKNFSFLNSEIIVKTNNICKKFNLSWIIRYVDFPEFNVYLDITNSLELYNKLKR